MQHASNIFYAVIQKLVPGQFANKHNLQLEVDNYRQQVLYVDGSRDIEAIENDMPEQWDLKEMHGGGYIIYTNTRELSI